ncbi:MAG: hypothetical protein SPD44_04440, partial [Prevotella sp.]|nr:hypothetical protein [Prevotella sp.]
DEVSGLLKEIEVMLSGRQYPIDVLARLWLARHVQRQSRIKPMRRICSFTDFFLCCWIYLRLSGAGIATDYLLLEASRAV